MSGRKRPASPSPDGALPHVGAVFGQRVLDRRKMLSLTQEQLAELVTEISGLPVSRLVVRKVEEGGQRAENVSLLELFAFAAALKIAPVYLMTPNEDEAVMTVPARPEIRADNVRAWVRGDLPLDYRDWPDYIRAMPNSEMQRGLQRSRRPGIEVSTTPTPSGALHVGLVPADDTVDGEKTAEDVHYEAWDLTEGEAIRLGEKPEPDDRELAENIYDDEEGDNDA
jgi:transcriptional regulator with XRE-family HTH domain